MSKIVNQINVLLANANTGVVVRKAHVTQLKVYLSNCKLSYCYVLMFVFDSVSLFGRPVLLRLDPVSADDNFPFWPPSLFDFVACEHHFIRDMETEDTSTDAERRYESTPPPRWYRNYDGLLPRCAPVQEFCDKSGGPAAEQV